ENNQTIYNFVLQGYEDDKFRNILKTTVETAFSRELFEDSNSIVVTTLNQGIEKLSDRINMIPIILTLNVSFMGLFLIASYIFLDKEEGTIKALAVTPNRMWEYLLGKMGVLLVSGIISGFLLMIVVVGTKANYLHFSILLITTSLFGSALGLFIASFFDSMTKAMGCLFSFVLIFALAATSYFSPSFSPTIIKFLPSYPIMFAFREVLLNNPNINYVYMTVLGFGIASIVLFIGANYRFKKTLTI
ncbi:MAG TPA: ABC transporter permease, partial [Clostridiales bacterium]|nr:ABC transporter permease [Clostridiales bacterium]